MKAALGMKKMLSIHSRADRGPQPRCARDGTGQEAALCLLGPTTEDGSPAGGWDSAIPIPRSPEMGGTQRAPGTGRRSLRPPAVEAPSTLCPCRRSLCWRSRRQNRTTHTPHPAATEPPHPGRPRLPPQQQADAPGPPGSLRASPQLLCRASGSGLHRSAPALRAPLPAPSWDETSQTRCRNPLPPPRRSQPPSLAVLLPLGKGTTPAEPRRLGRCPVAAQVTPVSPSHIAPGWRGCNAPPKPVEPTGPMCVTGGHGGSPCRDAGKGGAPSPSPCPWLGSTHPCPGGEETSGRAARLSNAGAAPKHLDFPGNRGREGETSSLGG